jgi:hypothetical protein
MDDAGLANTSAFIPKYNVKEVAFSSVMQDVQTVKFGPLDGQIRFNFMRCAHTCK